MLIKAKTLTGYKLECLDGEIGGVKEFYFDDQHWTIRYLVQPEKWIFYLQIIEIQLFDIEKPCKIIMLFYKITLQNAILSCRNDQSRAIQNRSSF